MLLPMDLSNFVMNHVWKNFYVKFLMLKIITIKIDSCPSGCSGNGVCQMGTCVCSKGFSGENCMEGLKIDQER